MTSFDPNAPADADAGIFGLPGDPATASAVVIPAPFEATTSFRKGAANGPDAITAASGQVDLHDTQFGAVYERGIRLADAPSGLDELSLRAANSASVAAVNEICAEAERAIEGAVSGVLADGATPIVLGGEHAVSLGAVRACAACVEALGVLQIDAHMDLRDAYEGYASSHASVLRNCLVACPNLERLVQIGIRDVGPEEIEYAQRAGSRIATHFDIDWARKIAGGGASYLDLCRQAVESLPDTVYVTVDIDGLDPTLCPDTGTPVPGGLGFNELALLLEALAHSGKRVIGMDLVEVAPDLRCGDAGREVGEDWNAIVGARVLYKLCALAAPR